MNQKKRAWVYTRIDAPEDRYGSLKKQDQRLTEYAQRMGWEVVGHSQDMSSSQDMKRPGLQALTNAIMRGEVDVLVVSCPSRISRQVKDINAYAELLRRFAVEAYSPEQGRIEVLSTHVLWNLGFVAQREETNFPDHQEGSS